MLKLFHLFTGLELKYIELNSPSNSGEFDTHRQIVTSTALLFDLLLTEGNRIHYHLKAFLDAGELEEDTGSGDVFYFSLISILNCYFQVTQIRQKIREVREILNCWFSIQFI